MHFFGVILHHHASWIRFLVDMCLQRQLLSKVRGFVLVMEKARSFTSKAEAGWASRVDPGGVIKLVGLASCRFMLVQADYIIIYILLIDGTVTITINNL